MSHSHPPADREAGGVYRQIREPRLRLDQMPVGQSPGHMRPSPFAALPRFLAVSRMRFATSRARSSKLNNC